MVSFVKQYHIRMKFNYNSATSVKNQCEGIVRFDKGLDEGLLFQYDDFKGKGNIFAIWQL